MSRRASHILLAALALAGMLAPAPARAQTLDLRNNLKKLQRYLADGFCEDALQLATDLRRREDGARSFEVWYGIVQAHYCAREVGAALAAVDELQQAITLEADEARILGNFTDDVEASFGQLRLKMPGNRPGHPRLSLRVVELEDPERQPFADAAIARLAEGVDVPGAPLYLPVGRYEVEWTEVKIEDFIGAQYVVGRARPSPWRRSQIGDGQSLGLGIVTLQGFAGEAFTVNQLSGESQVIVTEDRLSTTRTPYLSLSSTHSFPMGTLGRVAIRVDGRWRPQTAALGGVSTTGEDTELVPTYASAGLDVQLQRVEREWTLQGGIGARFTYFAYYEFIGFIVDGTEDATSDAAYRISVDTPVVGGGPELLGAVGRSFRVGSRGVQVGLEGSLGFAALTTTAKSGDLTVTGDDFDGTVSYELLGEVPWGTLVSVALYVRIPLF